MRIFVTFVSLAVGCLLFQGCGSKYVFQLDEHIGICGTGWAEVARKCGLNYLEANVSGFLCPESEEEAFEANLASMEGSLPIYSANGFFPGSIKVVGPEAETERAIRYSENAIRRAAKVGMKVLVLGSSGSRSIPEGFSREEAEDQFIALLKGLAPSAEKYGVKVGIEPLQTDETNFINTVREGAAITRKVGSPNVGVIADFFHMARMDEDPEAIVESADKLVHCHIAEKEKRTPPGVMGDDFTPYYKALKKIRYTGGISIECGWSDIETQLPEAVRTMREQICSVK